MLENGEISQWRRSKYWPSVGHPTYLRKIWLVFSQFILHYTNMVRWLICFSMLRYSDEQLYYNKDTIFSLRRSELWSLQEGELVSSLVVDVWANILNLKQPAANVKKLVMTTATTVLFLCWGYPFESGVDILMSYLQLWLKHSTTEIMRKCEYRVANFFDDSVFMCGQEPQTW